MVALRDAVRVGDAHMAEIAVRLHWRIAVPDPGA